MHNCTHIPYKSIIILNIGEADKCFSQLLRRRIMGELSNLGGMASRKGMNVHETV